MANSGLREWGRAGHPRVVIVGAGFGGMNAARRLAGAPVDVLLIDRNNHHLFQPLLYQVATAALSPSEIASPIRALFRGDDNVEILLGEAVGVDAAARTVSLEGVGPIGYDYLLLATGSIPSWFGHDEWAEHSISLKTLADADKLRDRLLGAFEHAENQRDPAERQKLLTFVVVGGGPTGVELAGSIRELARYTLERDFKQIDPASARVVMFEGGDTLLAGFPKRLRDYAERRLRGMGVEVHTGVQVSKVDESGVRAGDHHVESANVFWCAGVAATPVAEWLGAARGKHGTVEVGPDCSIAGHVDVFAVGDVATSKGKDGQPLPGVAPVAKQQGRYVADVILARVAGRPPPAPFRYNDQGSLAIIGRSSAVAEFPFVRLTGVLAWLMWGGVHLVLLNGLQNRVLVYVHWLWAWLTYSRGARLIEDSAGSNVRPPHGERA